MGLNSIAISLLCNISDTRLHHVQKIIHLLTDATILR